VSAAPRNPLLPLPAPPPSSAKQLRAAESMASFAAPAVERLERRRAFRGKSRTGIERAREQMNAMCESGEWGQATGDHLVALYEWLHEQVYGVATAELDGKNWSAAAAMANRMTKEYFGGDYGRAMLFMKWAWNRERFREEQRRARGQSGSRIGWRLQFSGALVTDHRVDVARTGG
jgi:hypothetical protein